MGKFRQILTELSARDIFSFPDDNLNKRQGILTKLGTCIDIKEIWFGVANGQILSFFDRVICPRHDNGGVLSFYFSFYLYSTSFEYRNYVPRFYQQLIKNTVFKFEPQDEKTYPLACAPNKKYKNRKCLGDEARPSRCTKRMKDEEQTITKETPHTKKKTVRENHRHTNFIKNCNRGTVLEKSVEKLLVA